METEEPRLPELVGPYRILRRLGKGGMGTVFEAENVKLHKRVALKALHEHLATRNISVARFLREGRAASQVAHPHVVTVFELGEENGIPYLVMELCEGIDLAQRIERGPLSSAECAEVMLPVISALGAAHAAAVVHRDLKPSNILLPRDRFGELQPKVVDFGICKMEGEGAADSLTQTQSVLGTMFYMSPEQARSARNADAKSDQYSLGVILYECVTGRRPFEGESPYDIMHAIMTAPLEPPSARVAGLPPSFDALVLRALARRPDDRFPSVLALGAALLELADPRVRARWAREMEPARVEVVPAREPAPLREATAADTMMSAAPATRSRRWPLIAGAGAIAAAAVLFAPREEPEVAPQESPPAAAVVETATVARAAPPAPTPVTPAPKKKATKAAARPVSRVGVKTEPELGDNGAPIIE